VVVVSEQRGGAVGVAALVTLLLTFRRGSTRWTAMAIGAIGMVGTVLCGGAAAVVILGSGPANSMVVVTDPVAPLAYGVSAAVLVTTLWSVARTLRAARA
jgi:hypothetical protein